MPTLDAELTRLASTIVDQAPEPPQFGDLHPVGLPARDRRRTLVLSALLIAAVLVATVVLIRSRSDTTSRRITTPAGSASTAPTSPTDPAPKAIPSGSGTLAELCASIPSDATKNVIDGSTHVGVTVSARSFCEQQAALSPDPAGDLGAVYYYVNGSVHAEYHNLIRTFDKAEGGNTEKVVMDPAPVDPAEAQQRIAEQRARRSY